MRGVAGPYPDRLVLRRGGYVGFLEHGRGPGHVADPVGVAGEFLDGRVGFVLCAADVSYQHDGFLKGDCVRDERTYSPRS